MDSARVCFVIDSSKLVPNTIKVVVEVDDEIEEDKVEVFVENIPLRCNKCEVFNHICETFNMPHMFLLP